ncbi:flippase [Fusobacterium polymorphum]|uniref:flippase n=1 Tax=Fusobacterium nucleatum subsp. polymorphum TaxID=76857 RepID=UPI003009BC6E
MSKILKNIGWLLFDKIFILILQFFIGVKVANYYGSSSFGLYNYALSIIAFSSILFELLNDRIIKKFFEEYNFSKVIYNVNIFRNTMAILILIFSIVIGKFLSISSLLYYTLILLAIDNVLLTSTQGIELYFDYKLNSKKIVILNNCIKLLSYFLQYVAIIFEFSIIVVPIIRCIGSLVRIIALRIMYKNIYLKNIKLKPSYNRGLILSIFKESFFLWISVVAVLIYTQIDKIMLGNMLGDKEVGVYSIGVSLIQILSILIPPIQVSLFPKMLELYKKNEEEYIKFYLKSNTAITQMYLFACIASIIFIKLIFLKLFSIEYKDAVIVYSILTIMVFFKANGALQTSHVTIKKITQKIFYKTFSGLFINIILNYIFIKKYGIVGAAIATSVTNFLTLFVMDFFIKEYREQAWIQLKSFNPLNLKK